MTKNLFWKKSQFLKKNLNTVQIYNNETISSIRNVPINHCGLYFK